MRPTPRAKVNRRAHREPKPKARRHLPVAALIAVALMLVLASSDFYAKPFWFDHPATTAILASLVVVLVSVTAIEVILNRRSERRWRLLAQYALMELAETARDAWAGTPQGISKAALLLASEDSSYVTGIERVVYGGMMRGL